MTTVLLLTLLGCYSSVLGARTRHAALLELQAAQDFEWRNMYYRQCGHWGWQKDWEKLEVTATTPTFDLT